MTFYLWRAIALETTRDEFTDELLWVTGESIGRATGYLSRSSAKSAGDAAGIDYTLVKSLPVVFPVPRVVEQAQRIADLEEQLASEPVAAALQAVTF